ncbi:MAG: protein-tyrosine-phosphatase [Saprospiraceae bacterium]|nr:protein-tyrosine-phosphatase [Saprospiraceae bacterium]
MLTTSIHNFYQEIEKEFDQISDTRKEKLSQLSSYISAKFNKKQIPKLVVICTHNSRRSHMGQILLAAGASYLQLPELETYSGGTEATAFHKNAIKAFHRLGFLITTTQDTVNPVYKVNWADNMLPYQAFSKNYREVPNPQSNFAAIMVCSEADEGCPLVLGCDFRIALPFEDPKEFDGTTLEQSKYDAKIREIGREMLFILKKVNY